MPIWIHGRIWKAGYRTSRDGSSRDHYRLLQGKGKPLGRTCRGHGGDDVKWIRENMNQINLVEEGKR